MLSAKNKKIAGARKFYFEAGIFFMIFLEEIFPKMSMKQGLFEKMTHTDACA